MMFLKYVVIFMKFSVIPQPQKILVGSDETVFELTESTNLIFCDEAQNAYDDFVGFSKKVFGFVPMGGGKQTVVVKTQEGFEKSESYNITVDYDRIDVVASDAAGAFYAVQTLKQLLLQNKLCLPKAEIVDFPQYKWRGFMLDTGRYFYSVESVKLFIDAMALHKLNRLHLHLTDDQGWRVEIYSKLLLAQVGGFRPYTNFGRTPHGGFYTKEDIKEIVDYAHDRFIKVIPEIDQPGHTVSAIAAYPELSCFEREIPVATHSGVKHDVLCAGKESTYEFMFCVLDEICEMFPDKIVHLGGDEVPVTRWKLCPHCQKLMKEKGMKDESELHTYYLSKIASYLKDKGVDVIMWNDSSPESKLSKDIIWQCWNGDLNRKDAAQQINSGRRLINSISEAYYLDLPYGHINLKKCYDYEPFFEGIDKDKENDFLGGEACLWSEYVPTMKKAGYCTFPRLAAFCESVWTKKENKSYDAFALKMPFYYRLLDTLPFDYASKKQAMPGIIRKTGYNLWFERRKLHWQGLHNIIDNNKVKKLAEEKEKNNA